MYFLSVGCLVFTSLNIQADEKNFSLEQLVSEEVSDDQIIIRNYSSSDAELTGSDISDLSIPPNGGAIIPCLPEAEYNFLLDIETDSGNYFYEFDSYCGSKFVIYEDRDTDGIEI